MQNCRGVSESIHLPEYPPAGPHPSETTPAVTWSPLTAILAAIGALLAGFLIAVPILILAAPAEGEDLSTRATVAVQLATVIGFLLVPIWVASRPSGGLRLALVRLGVRSFRPGQALKWMAAAFCAYFVFVVIYAQLIATPEQDDIASSFGPLPVQIFLIVICASVAEELCFRGLLFGGLRPRFGTVAAALIAAVVFGALHATTGVSAVPPLIAFGFVLALLYAKTGSIWPSILLHAFNNGLALAALQA